MAENRVVFAFPGDLATLTGGYGYDRKVITGLGLAGISVDALSLGPGFPFPDGPTLEAAESALASLADGTVVVADGLAFGVLGDIAERLANRLKLIALVHHPLCLENGLSASEAETLRAAETKALQYARHVIVTSPATAEQVHQLFGISRDAITTALPGTERPDRMEVSQGGPVRLLSIGTVTHRKGYDLLFTALGALKDLDWHLDVVGGLEAAPECVRALKKLAGELQLENRLTFHGAVPQENLGRYYEQAGVFVLASRYEGYGMAYTEALSYSLPVIGSGAGAVRETLSGGGAIYCGVEDVAALQVALERLISDPEARQALAQDAQIAAQTLPKWSDTAETFAAVIKKVRA